MSNNNTQSLPHHPATSTSTSSDVKSDAARSFDTPAAHHAMEHTSSWTPRFDRRQSWSKEDQKRSLQMTGIADNGSGGKSS